MFQRLIAVLTLFLVPSLLMGDDEQKNQIEKSEAEIKARRDKIHAEIKQLGKHDWAGEYHSQSSVLFPTRLILSPEMGFIAETFPQIRFSSLVDFGSIAFKDNSFTLSLSKNLNERDWPFPSEYYLVRWGTRRYLIPPDEFMEFCNSVNLGIEPRQSVKGKHLLRYNNKALDNDILKVEGLPEVPRKYQSHLLTKPIEASIIAVGQTSTKKIIRNLNSIQTRVTLDAGYKQGLKGFMALVVTNPANAAARVRILDATETQSEALIFWESDNPPEPKIGWRLSTRDPKSSSSGK